MEETTHLTPIETTDAQMDRYQANARKLEYGHAY